MTLGHKDERGTMIGKEYEDAVTNRRKDTDDKHAPLPCKTHSARRPAERAERSGSPKRVEEGARSPAETGPETRRSTALHLLSDGDGRRLPAVSSSPV